MRCRCYKCDLNDDGYCSEASYVCICEDGTCDRMFIRSTEEPTKTTNENLGGTETMKAFNGLEIKRSVSASEPLPAGGYVAKILNAKVEEYSWGEVLVISFDVAEGEYKDFFSKQYKENTREDKKWKGNFRLTVPQENNQYFDSQKRTFGNAIWAVEESNSGWHWSWDENALKGKMVGVLFRNYEYDVDGRRGWSTECCTFVSVEDVRTGNFKQPKDKPLKNKPVNNAPASSFAVLDDPDADLPF